MTESEREAVARSNVAIVAEASGYLQLFLQALAIAIRTHDDNTNVTPPPYFGYTLSQFHAYRRASLEGNFLECQSMTQNAAKSVMF